MTRTVHSPAGDRLIRVALPREHEHGWVTWWSVEGGPSGTVTYPAAGPDSLGSLQRALADAERAAAVI
ncbi:hypothetical protein [Tsukamurella sp. 1534]|uniref:hypothetical protein n=1 Tax=Tsukamurella sp. 1534 TaxID=1151061 RepID=UPI0002E53FD4|nr:hypothetical protein [Tsukamurella sp. 1534]